MPRTSRENPVLVLLIFLILTAGLVYFLILVWEIPSPAQSNVRCEVEREVFIGGSVDQNSVCAPAARR